MKIAQEHYDGTTTTGDHYRCVGNVRGWCGHRHRSLVAAVRCLKSGLNGGGSDRQILTYDGNSREGVAEYDHLV